MDALGLPHEASAKLPMQLSGGMAQRVVFAAAHAGGAPIVIVDEPTKGLDASRRDDVVALLKSTVEAGGVLLTITHDIAVATPARRLRDGDARGRTPRRKARPTPCSPRRKAPTPAS